MFSFHKNLGHDQADVCVIGAGAGGCVVAKELAEAGFSVILLEAGEEHNPAHFSSNVPQMLHNLFWDGGSRTTQDGAIMISQGRGVGGSTVHNFCYAVRPPELLLAHWQKKFALADLSLESLAPSLSRVEEILQVKQIQDCQVNTLNKIVLRGSQSLGWHAAVQKHNRQNCPDCSANCLLGCHLSKEGQGKQSMAVTYVPRALRAGARLYTRCTAQKILHKNNRAIGVQVSRVLDGKANTFQIASRAVVLAAGAVHSAQIWQQSYLPDPGHQAGRNLHLHPSIFMGGLFEEKILADQGITQSCYVDEFLDWCSDVTSGYLLMPAFGAPALVACMLPGWGHQHRQWMQNYQHLAGVLVLLHDTSSGFVKPHRQGHPIISYQLNQLDRQKLAQGLMHAAKLLLAAGAKEVIVPYAKPLVAKENADLDQILARRIVEHDIAIASSHPQGSLRMGGDPNFSVVNAYGQAHAVSGLFVCDASLFPTSIGIPPTITIAALADRIGHAIVKYLAS